MCNTIFISYITIISILDIDMSELTFPEISADKERATLVYGVVLTKNTILWW